MRLAKTLVGIVALAALGACAAAPEPTAPNGIYDPFERQNRKMHEANKRSDSGVLRTVAKAYVETVPEGVQDNISNFADTASLPKTVVNQILQGRLGEATRNTLRFTVNATLGFGGLADVASDLGLPQDESDFGETLHVWGAHEGAYLELPFIGPTTERDLAGDIVDVFIDPIGLILSADSRLWVRGARISDKLQDRGRFSNTIDSVLYESADSYAQTRLIYIQNRRHELGYFVVVPGEEIDPLALDTEGF